MTPSQGARPRTHQERRSSCDIIDLCLAQKSNLDSAKKAEFTGVAAQQEAPGKCCAFRQQMYRVVIESAEAQAHANSML